MILADLPRLAGPTAVELLPLGFLEFHQSGNITLTKAYVAESISQRLTRPSDRPSVRSFSSVLHSSVHPFVRRLSVRPSIHSSVRPSICPPIYLSVPLSESEQVDKLFTLVMIQKTKVLLLSFLTWLLASETCLAEHISLDK